MNTLFSQLLTTYSASITIKSARKIVGTSLFHSNSSLYNTNKAHILRKSCNLNLITSELSYRVGVIKGCYSSSTTRKGKTRKRKARVEPVVVMEDEKDAFFVVRKGDVVGVYMSLSDCQAQVGSSICDPPVSVYKGYSLPKEAEAHLVSRGLQNALYTINASDLNDDLFGTLTPCPFQEPALLAGETSSMDFPQKRPHDDMPAVGNMKVTDAFSLTSIGPSSKLQKLKATSSDTQTCVLEFDGASKGNPGPAGAGAVLRTLNGNVICKIREGLGIATNNVAEYKAVILGLRRALELGYTSIRAKGDSKLVCMQLQGLWKVKNQNMADLHAEATKLMKKFTSFQISHVLRDLNSDADEQANMGVALPNGQSRENLSEL